MNRTLPGWLVVLLLVASAALGFGLALGMTGTHVATGSAYSAEDQISVVTDDWTYAIPVDVEWHDASGGWHLGSRPECLPPSLEPITVTFGWVPVTAEGSSWRAVVWVSCEGTGPTSGR